ncbi:MAG: hypothetical protein PUB20_04145 [Clostridia bacterium]|nr:hypothetical protein [Clostridia bacterium]
MKLKKLLAIVVSASMLASGAAVGAYAADGVDYKINSTYANVDWDIYNQYKADLHTHSSASDGSLTKTETVEAHYEYGFDIMALTDHGTVDAGWDTEAANRIVRIGKHIGDNTPIDPLESEGVAANGKRYTYANDYYTQFSEDGTAERSMMRVPNGNEQNPTSFNNAHVCTWFADYGDDSVGGTSDYETPIKAVDKLGGLSVINHPGEYTGARNEQYEEDAYNTSNIKYRYIVNKFANILKEYDSCIGVDVNSKGDNRTRYDRKLWDLLLQEVVPSGRNVYAIATSDAHNEGIINSGYTMMLMPEKTADALKSCMQNGEFYAESRYLGNKSEIKAWAEELRAAGIGDELASDFEELYATICEEENAGKQRTVYEFDEDAAAPRITNISVDDFDDTITVDTKDAYLVRWIADGKIIAVGDEIDLDDYSEEIGSYVRAEVLGEGGVIYTQAFTLEYEGAPEAEDGCFVDFGCAASLICDTIVKVLAFALKITGIVALVYHFV